MRKNVVRYIEEKTRMTTSISSKAFCSITDRQTDKIFTEQMLIYERILHKFFFQQYLNYGPRKSRFPLNVVDRRTDICFYRVALLLKINILLTSLQTIINFPLPLPPFLYLIYYLFMKGCKIDDLLMDINLLLSIYVHTYKFVDKGLFKV